MALFEMPVAGACWVYALCNLFTCWRDWRRLCSLPTGCKEMDGSSHLGRGFSEKSPPWNAFLCFCRNTFDKLWFALLLRNVSQYDSFFDSAERTVTFAIVTVSGTFTPQTRHQCTSGESMDKQTCPLFFPWGWLANKEVAIQGGVAKQQKLVK